MDDAIALRLEARLDQLFDAVGLFHQQHMLALEALSARVGRLEIRLDSMEDLLISIDRRLGSLEKRVESIEIRVGAIEQRLSDVVGEVSLIQLRLGVIESELGGLRSEVDRLAVDTQQRFRVLGERVGEIEKRLAA